MTWRLFFPKMAETTTTAEKKKKEEDGDDFEKEEEGKGQQIGHVVEFISEVLSKSDIQLKAKTVFCYGRRDPNGDECMCATFLENFLSSEGHDAAAAENLEEMFKFGHKTREELLVSASKCTLCPPTKPPPPKETKKKEEEEKEGKEEKKEEEKKANSCRGYACFNGCVSEKEETVDGHGAAGACSKCNRMYNNLAAVSKRSKKGSDGRKKYMERNYEHIDYVDENFSLGKIPMPFPTERKLLPYYVAGRCGLCDRVHTATEKDDLFGHSEAFNIVPKVFGPHFVEIIQLEQEQEEAIDRKTRNNTQEKKKNAHQKLRRSFVNRVTQILTDAVRRLDTEDKRTEVCFDCVVAVTVEITNAFADHVKKNRITCATLTTLKHNELMSKTIEAVKALDFDHTQKGAIEMEYGKAWLSDTRDRKADSSDFSSKNQLPQTGACRLAFHWIRISETSANKREGVVEEFDIDSIATLGRLGYGDSKKLVIPGTHERNGVQVVSPLYICPEPYMKTGPYGGSLFYRRQKKPSSVESDVASWKELAESVNNATAYNPDIVVSIVMNSPEDLTGDFNNLHTALSVFKSPERVFLVWKNTRGEEDRLEFGGFGGTVSIRVLTRFMSLRINFRELLEKSKSDDGYVFVMPEFCKVGDGWDFFAAAKFLKLIDDGRVADRRGKKLNQHRTASNGATAGGYHPGKDEILSQDKEDFNKESSQNSNTENTPIQSTGEMYVLSWGAEPLPRLPGKDPNSPNEFFSRKTLTKVKLREGFKINNQTKRVILRSSSKKKRITPKVPNEEKETGNEKKKKKK